MAAPSDVSVRKTTTPNSQEESVAAQLNNLVTQLRVLCTKLDADAGVTDTNYFALVCDSAVAAAPAKVTTV